MLPLMHAAGAWPWLAPLWLLFWLLVVGTFVHVLVWRRGAWSRCGRGQTATEVLAERFARGEIDAAEFRSRRETLGQ